MEFAARRGLCVVIAGVVSTFASADTVFACDGHVCTPDSCFVKTGVPTIGDPHSPPMLNSFPIARNMTLMSQMPLGTIGGGSGASLFGWTDPQTKREYAIMGRSNGTAFIDITNPRVPKYVGELPKVAGSANTTWREPKVYQNTVYIGVDGTSVGMQVMDLTKLRAYNGTTLPLTANSVYTGGITRIHTMAINQDTGYLYLNGTNAAAGGMKILNVQNPLNPTDAGIGSFSGDGYTHESQSVIYHGPDATYQGREIVFNSNGKQGGVDTFSIVDATNKTSITRLSSATYPQAGYIHQGWLTEDHRYFFMNDELDETGGQTGGVTRTHLWDVQDLNSPVYKGFIALPTTSVDHNMYVKDGFLFEANYTTGLRMFKIGDLSSSDSSQWITEVAYYDTYAPNDNATFNGAWNSYPFFASGNVPISDINGGLFVVQPQVSGWELNPWDPRGGGGGGGLPGQSPEPATAGVLLGAGILGMARRRSR